MEGKNTLAAATLAATLTASSPTIAEGSEAKALQEAITCETKLACQKLTESIQAQIDELKTKGLRNLTKPERREFAQLKKQFIAVENQKQEKQQVTIASEQAETLDIARTDQKIAELRGTLLEN